MKRRKLLFCSLMIVTVLFTSGCSATSKNDENAAVDLDEVATINEASTISDEDVDEVEEETQDEEDPYLENYVAEGGQVALLTGFSSIDDHSYMEAIYSGIQMYAYSADVTYSYYTPAGSSDSAFEANIEKAIEGQAKLIVCADLKYASLISSYANDNPDIYFLMVDCAPATLSENIHCLDFDETAAGFLAGYITALDGYTKFGFIGGEQVPAVLEYGYGYLQGINTGAAEINTSSDIEVNYWYANTYLPNNDIKETATDWYDDGTEVIFCCGGKLYESVLEAAGDDLSKKLIGVDVDQNFLSDHFLTSAMKGVDTAMIDALDNYFAYDCWPDELAGKTLTYGVDKWCLGLPTDEETWRFTNVTLDDYLSIYLKLKNDELSYSDSIEEFPALDIKVTTFD